MNAFEKIMIAAIIIAVILNIALYFNLKPECFENFESFPALYINLDHREDRKNHIESELKKIKFNNYQRFNAVKNKKGYLGCSQSHIDCLKIAKANNYPNVMILEDDFEFLIDKDEFKMILDHLLTVDYDVFILAYNTNSNNITDTGDKYLKKIEGTQTTSGYIVNQRYYDKLMANFEEGLRLLKQTDNPRQYAIDMYWKPLQSQDNWYCYKKRIGKQMESYSDIENKNVNYNV